MSPGARLGGGRYTQTDMHLAYRTALPSLSKLAKGVCEVLGEYSRLRAVVVGQEEAALRTCGP